MTAPTATISTRLGDIQIEFLPDKAPEHVKNFTDLAKKGFYNGTAFHRVIPGFMVQGGCPNTKEGAGGMPGTGGPGYTIKAEFNDTAHLRGVVSMARAADPDSAGCQFFVVVKDSAHLDGQYTAFGRVTSGMDVADAIVAQPRDGRDMPKERVEMTVTINE
jgi:peptidyl-prolyl cis-trans isomerase B (cyclophilin B)